MGEPPTRAGRSKTKRRNYRKRKRKKWVGRTDERKTKAKNKKE